MGLAVLVWCWVEEDSVCAQIVVVRREVDLVAFGVHKALLLESTVKSVKLLIFDSFA